MSESNDDGSTCLCENGGYKSVSLKTTSENWLNSNNTVVHCPLLLNFGVLNDEKLLHLLKVQYVYFFTCLLLLCS